MGFRLKKRYMDCISGEEAIICYSAILQYGFIKMTYGAVITQNQEESFDAGEFSDTEKRIIWKNKGLDIKGEWNGENGMEKTLYSSKGEIIWRCIQPHSMVKIIYKGKEIIGKGYIEELDITVPPWRLPFKELRWGRFSRGSKFVVWIDWKGGLDKTWIWTEKGESKGTVKDNEVAWKSRKLELSNTRIIRSGNLSESLLGNFAFILGIFPKLRRIVESKYISHAKLGSIKGTAIHEVVRW